MTRSLTSIMTPGFAPLEQYQTSGQGPWTDIYALGAVMYKCVSGNKPQDVLNRISNDTLQSPDSETDKLYSPGLIMGIMAALTVPASDRPRCLQDWLQILDGRSQEPTVKMPDKPVRHEVESIPAPPPRLRDQSTGPPESKSPSGPRNWLLLAIPFLLLSAGVSYWIVAEYSERQRIKAVQLAQKQADEQVAAKQLAFENAQEEKRATDLQAKRIADQQEKERLLAEVKAANQKLAALQLEKQQKEAAERKEQARLAVIADEKKRKAEAEARMERERLAAIAAENKRIADEKARLFALGNQLPVWESGDRWHYVTTGKHPSTRDEFIVGETSFGGQEVYIQQQDTVSNGKNHSSKALYDKATLNLIRTEFKVSGKDYITTWENTLLEGTEWPKEVGNKWRKRTSFSAGETTSSNITSFEVVGIETITVPAGTFKCYKIVTTLTNDKVGFDQKGTMWFSAKAKNYVKYQHTTRWHKLKRLLMGKESTSVTELISYKVSQ